MTAQTLPQQGDAHVLAPMRLFEQVDRQPLTKDAAVREYRRIVKEWLDNLTEAATGPAVQGEQRGHGRTSPSAPGSARQEREQRQRNLMLHIQLIEHAAKCTSKSCTSTNCAKMKQYLQHARVCKVKVNGGCRICKRIWTLLRIHAQKCKDPRCPIPQCTAIREKMRQLQKQQQAMDDRRRLEMNRHMRFGGAMG